MSEASGPVPEEFLETLMSARIVDLEQPRYSGQPGLPQHGPSHTFVLHRRHEPDLGPRTSSTGLLVCSDHAGTHVDALAHQAHGMQMFGDVPVTAEVQTHTGFTQHGADEIPPILRRGVLLDVAGTLGPLEPGASIGVADLEAAVAAADIEIREGAVILVRTGFGAHWDDPQLYLRAPGISREASEWVAAWRPFAVGIDNATWDDPDAVDPVLGARLPGHVLFLIRTGTFIIENLDLETLASTGQATFAFLCLPLKIRGATGSPVRPVALVGGADDRP